MQQLDDKGFHQEGDPAVAFCPGNRQFLNGAVAVLELGDARFDERLKLAGVQVPPLAFGPAVDVGAFGRVRRVGPDLPLLENDFNDQALFLQRNINRLNRPRRFQPKKVFVQGGVFHDVVSDFEKMNSVALRKNSQCN